MLGVGNSAILKKKNVCKSLVEPICAILARFSIFSVHQRLIILSTEWCDFDFRVALVSVPVPVRLLLIDPGTTTSTLVQTHPGMYGAQFSIPL